MELEVQQELELLSALELVVPRKMELWLELPPTLELGVQQQLEP